MTTSANTYSFTVTPTEDVDNLRLSFFVGQSDVNFWLDNVVFKNTSCEEPDFEFVWECRESDGVGGFGPWVTIPGATMSSYDSPVQTQTKQYRRLASAVDCDDFSPSNAVEVEVCPCEAFAGDEETICFGASVELSATGTGVGDLSYSWTPAATLSDANISNPTATPSETTMYVVTITDANGCEISDSTLITVHPEVNADAGIDVAICEGDSIQLVGTGTGLTYEWSPATGLSDPNVANPLAFPTTTTTYTLTATSAEGCIATDDMTVIVNGYVDAGVIATSHDYCEDGSGAATVTILNGTGPFTINWQNDNGGETGSATIDNPGDYTIPDLNGDTTYCIEVIDANGCGINTP